MKIATCMGYVRVCCIFPISSGFVFRGNETPINNTKMKKNAKHPFYYQIEYFHLICYVKYIYKFLTLCIVQCPGAVGCGPQEEFRACADITIGDNEATLPPKLPKQPTTSAGEIPPDASPLPKSGPYWLFSIIIAGTCLLVVLAAMALLYTYYYHAGRAKEWLMARRLLVQESPPIAPPRHKKHHHISNTQLQL